MNACGKLPSRRPARGRTPRRGGRRRCAARAAARRARGASSWRPVQREVVGQPERAGQERALAGRQAVDVGAFGRSVAVDEAVRASGRARSPRPCRRTRGSVAGRKPTSGIISRLASSCCRAVGLDERAALGVEALAADLVVDLVAEALASGRRGPSRPKRSTALTRPVERDPRHHLRVGEVPPRAAHLPDPLVGLLPARLEEVETARAASRQAVVDRRRGPRCGPGSRASIDLAVDVELELAREAALPMRTGVELLVAGEPRQLELGEPPLAGRGRT